MLNWLYRLFRPNYVSDRWLKEYAIHEMGEGWEDGPRWRSPKEIQELYKPQIVNLEKRRKRA